MAGNVRFLNPKTMAKPPGYTYVVEATGPNRLIFIAGQLGLDLDNKLVGGPGDFRAQAFKAFENLKFALARAGATLQGRGEDQQLSGRHVAHRNFPRGARRVRQYRGAAGLDHGGDFATGAAGRAVRGRGDRGAAGESGGQGSEREGQEQGVEEEKR